MTQILILYLISVNILAFILFGADKWKAKHRRWRIRESALIGTAVIGGSVGALLGMLLFRHKTKHQPFRLGLPLILIGQILFAIFICGRL